MGVVLVLVVVVVMGDGRRLLTIAHNARGHPLPKRTGPGGGRTPYLFVDVKGPSGGAGSVPSHQSHQRCVRRRTLKPSSFT